ncbi:MAG TPA: VOC family protein [Flavobacteriales bacterium]|nr:VOC family protein [Flavobacteriales bacterium]
MQLPDARSFLHRVFAVLRSDGVDVSPLLLDHICYRVATAERYLHWKDLLSKNGDLLGETMIGGRPISTFKLHEPIIHLDRRITVVELPAPKEGSPYIEGWEHVEFVVGIDPRAFAARYPSLPWDMSGADKASNPDVRLSYDGFSVKFHQRSLEEVIAQEG